VLLELLNSAIRRPQELTTSLGITPFAVLSYIETPRERRRRRLLWMILGGGVLLLLVGGLWAIQTYYLPLDLLFARVVERLGLKGILPF
jgi:hypothetical protein